jgi:hypothetical protein
MTNWQLTTLPYTSGDVQSSREKIMALPLRPASLPDA